MNILLKIYLVFAVFFFSTIVNIYSCRKSDNSNNPQVPVVPIKSDVAFWLTNPEGSVNFTKQNISLLFTNNSNSNPSITVDSTKTYQTMDGFGCCLTGGSATLIHSLPVNVQNQLLQELFSTDSTYLGLSYLRISIGASDLSAYSPFTYDDMPSGQTDTTLSNFSITPEQVDLIPILQKIIAINPTIKILGSPWTAPPWMKYHETYIGDSLNPKYYSTYANYFVKYLQGMQTNGIHLDAITVQNEPLNPGNDPSMYMVASNEDVFVKNYLGPAFAAAKLTTKIIIWDHNCDVPQYPISILSDTAAAKYVDGSAFHLYAGSITALSQVHDAFPTKNVYFTEQWVSGPSNFEADFDWHMQNLIIGAPNNWSRNVLEWNMASDPTYNPHTQGGCSTCLGALTITSTDYTRNTSYYIMAHASKFVRPGSVRIASSTVSGLTNVAYDTPSGQKVLIVLNIGSSTITFNIVFNGKSVSSSLVAGSAGTYVW